MENTRIKWTPEKQTTANPANPSIVISKGNVAMTGCGKLNLPTIKYESAIGNKGSKIGIIKYHLLDFA